jgi:tripartite-type tricarboxylate transporter receptor subunit TctC
MAAMAALAFTAAIGQAVPAVAQSAEAFYRGKTIKLIVPSGAGGAYGLYALLLAGHYGRHIPGNPSIVADFRSGAGGTVAANYLYNAAPKDGSVIGMPLAPIVLAQHTRGKSAKYDASKFIWIGRMAEITRLFSVWQTTKAQTLEDLSKMQVIVGSTGKGSETFMNPAVMNSLLGTKFKIVTGYKGSAKVMHALEQGEITGAFSTWGNFNGNHPDWIRDGKVKFLLQVGFSRLPQYPNVPLMHELAKTDEARQVIEYMSRTSQVGHSVLAPPGVPQHLVAALRTAFQATMKDAKLLADAKKRRADIAPASHTELEDAIKRAVNAAPAVVERFKAAVGAKK